MINKKYLKNLRCKGINNKNDFIFDLYGNRIIDSLDIISLDFKNILILGDHGTNIYKYLKKRFKNSLITICDFEEKNSNIFRFYDFKIISSDLDTWLDDNKKYDLILSNFFLNLSNNYEKIFQKIHNSLLSNGFFLASLPSPNNFLSLKNAMLKTDIYFYGGAYQRFNKTINLENIVEELKKNNFKIPLVNYEKIELEYKNFEQLLFDIRSMKLSYYYKDKKNTFEKKLYFEQLKKNYVIKKKNRYELLSEFYIISGWKEHESQQKPMRPGEAKNKLKDYLN